MIACCTAANGNGGMWSVSGWIPSARAVGCKDKRQRVGRSGNASAAHAHVCARAHTHGVLSVWRLGLQILCPGEPRDHWAALLLSHCLVLAM